MPHTSSKVCQKPGVAFVLGVSAIIEDQFAPTKYGEFYKQCKLDRYHPGEVPKKILENEMLCVLMCCCNKFPARGKYKNIYQGCVKDILDEVNELKKGSKELPKSRFVAEPTLNVDLKEVGRGRMNPGGPPKQGDQSVVRPDVGILKKVPDEPSTSFGTLVLDEFERLVEMKFPTESLNEDDHFEQIKIYLSFCDDVTLMIPDFGINNPFDTGSSTWHCNCAEKEKKELIQEGEVYSAAEKKKHNHAIFHRFLDIISIPIPWTRPLKGLRGIGGVGKILKPSLT